MKILLYKIYLRRFIEIAALVFLLAVSARPLKAQCLPGSNTALLNWDNLDYLVTSGAYTGFVTASMSRSQAFAIGVNRVEIVHATTIGTSGENNAHTGEAGSVSTGADVQYNGSGTITYIFDNEVNGFEFSLYDIDNNQRVNVTAVNALGAALPVIMTRPAAGNVTITGSGSTNAQGQAPAIAQASTSNIATINLLITGPVKSVTVTLAGTAGDFWLSDLEACVSGSFPTDYFVASRPFTGQPTYIIGTSDTNTVSLINTTTGQAKMIFQDITSPRYINGIGYDHLQHNLYYVVDFTVNPAINKSIRRYDFDTEAMITIVADVNTLGIPTFNRGVESAGCAFYDNDLYFGVEGNAPNNNGGRETIIWRIEFDSPGGAAIKACQVYATPSDNGSGTVQHDWNDFTIADGILVDFAGAPTTSQRRFTHYDLQTQTIVNNYFTGGLTPRQAGISWNDTRYWVYDGIAVYNENGTIGAQTPITGASVLDWVGFCGDATGFRPKSDFGDAPSMYDPDPLSPALHEKDTALRLGPLWDQEFDKISSVNADADGSDEDGISTVQVLDTGFTTYLAQVRVYNNTGTTARLAGWLDINGNGVFEAGEGRLITVPFGGPVLQMVTLSWVGINTPLTISQNTYLRIRLTRNTSGMNTSNATGYYNNGEVEDYRVFMGGVLPVQFVSFTATSEPGKKVKLVWVTENESQVNAYSIEKSFNGTDWQTIQSIPAVNQPGRQEYRLWDQVVTQQKVYYRVKVTANNDGDRYSTVQVIQPELKVNKLIVATNPVVKELVLQINSMSHTNALLQISDAQGKLVTQLRSSLLAGANQLVLPAAISWPAGVYYVRMFDGPRISTARFVIVK